MTYRALLLSLPVLAVLGCPKKGVNSATAETTAGPETALIEERKDSEGNLVQEIDLDGNGKAEVYRGWSCASPGVRPAGLLALVALGLLGQRRAKKP